MNKLFVPIAAMLRPISRPRINKMESLKDKEQKGVSSTSWCFHLLIAVYSCGIFLFRRRGLDVDHLSMSMTILGVLHVGNSRNRCLMFRAVVAATK